MADLVAIAMERKRTQEDLQIANEALERRVAERALPLERQKSQDALKEQSRFLESFFMHSINPLVFLDRHYPGLTSISLRGYFYSRNIEYFHELICLPCSQSNVSVESLPREDMSVPSRGGLIERPSW